MFLIELVMGISLKNVGFPISCSSRAHVILLVLKLYFVGLHLCQLRSLPALLDYFRVLHILSMH